MYIFIIFDIFATAMETEFLTYKFRLLPNNEQKEFLNVQFGNVRFVYNYFLDKHLKENYMPLSNYIDLYDLVEKFCWLKKSQINSLEYSYKKFCNNIKFINSNQSSELKFLSKRKFNCFNIKSSNVEVIKNKFIKIPMLNSLIKCIVHRKIKGQILLYSIIKYNDGKFYVNILTQNKCKKQRVKCKNIVGLDLGIKNIVTTSDGKIYDNPKYINKYLHNVSVATKHLHNKKRGSNSFERQRIKLAKLYKKIANSRKDNLHKISREIVNNYDAVCCEKLNIKDLVKNHTCLKVFMMQVWEH